MNKTILSLVLLLSSAAAVAAVKLDISLTMDGVVTEKSVTLQDGEHAAYVDERGYMIDCSVTEEDGNPIMNMRVTKAGQGEADATTVCEPVMKLNWGEQGVVECTACKDEAGASRFVLKATVTKE